MSGYPTNRGYGFAGAGALGAPMMQFQQPTSPGMPTLVQRLDEADRRNEALAQEVEALRHALALSQAPQQGDALFSRGPSMDVAGGGAPFRRHTSLDEAGTSLFSRRTSLMKTPAYMMAGARGGPAPGTADGVIWELHCGNQRYMKRRADPEEDLPLRWIDVLKEDPLQPAKVKAIVVTEAKLKSVITVFDQAPGELHVIRVCGFLCGVAGPQCGVMGSVEFALTSKQPTVLLILGNSDNESVQNAVRVALAKAGRTDLPPSPEFLDGYKAEDFELVKALLPAAQDALLQYPSAPFAELCAIAVKLNVWRSIETLIKNSSVVFELVESGRIHLHGAVIDPEGSVEFLGKHPSIQSLMLERPLSEAVRTARDAPMPAEQALACLHAGNERFSRGKGGQASVRDERLLVKLSEAGQNPVAVVLGCADSRAPVEILFDMQPGDIFVLRCAGNTVAYSKGTIIGSAEYAISHLRTKLIVVQGHTKCGAVTATVDSVKKGLCHTGYPGSIGHVLADIRDEAAEAVKDMPQADVETQVQIATRRNVFATIEKMIKFSDIVKEAVMKGDLHIHGSIYDIFAGTVQWLGQHPRLQDIVGQNMPLHEWNTTPYVRQPRPPRGDEAKAAIALLQEGNKRFVEGARHCRSPCSGGPDSIDLEKRNPFALVHAGSLVRVPVECIFDVRYGEVVVQRNDGSSLDPPGGTVFSSCEYAIARWQPKVLVVLGKTSAHTVKIAIDQIHGAKPLTAPMRAVLDGIMVSALRATEQVGREEALTAAGRDVAIQQLAVELNALYTIEQLLRSPVIRSAVRSYGLELHAAILNEYTGEVTWVGEHPQFEAILHAYGGEVTSNNPQSSSEGESE